ncbi:MAG: hypothetical protein KAU27_00260 [Desulfuromonadales bacterium]|nr:hypothetical protein [Desulfuromonadales bacterium]
MKYLASLLVCILCFATVAFADNSGRKARQNLYELEPIHTRNARNAQRFTANLTYDNFRNVRIEEAEEFDGYTTTAEVIVPFGTNNRWEVRLEIPFYTDGDAWSIKEQQDIDIDGNGGVFDFANVVLQREISTADKCPVNTSAYFGYGRRTEALETSINDKYNHRGQLIRLGFNIDNARKNRDIRLQASLDGRYYFDTDDLNPSDNGTEFYLMNLSGAAVYNAEGFIKPAFEVLYSTDFNKRQIIQAVPELIIPVGDMVEIKGGYAFGNSEGEGSTQTATIRTTFRF